MNKKTIAYVATGFAASAALISTIVFAVKHQEKVADCAKTETQIIEQLTTINEVKSAVNSGINAIQEIRTTIEEGDFFTMAHYMPKFYETAESVKNLQDQLDELTSNNRYTASLYRSGFSCKLSEKHRETQWKTKFVPLATR